MERNKLVWRLACIAALLPCAAAVFAHYLRPSQPMAIAAPPRPALAFEQYLVDLRRIEPSSEVRATFVFQNRSTKPVQILNVEPSCGCLEPYISPRAVEPGQSGRIVLRLQPAGEPPGRKELYADVEYYDGQRQDVRLTFKLEIPEEGLMVKPRAVLVYQNGNRPVSKQIVVTDSRPQPARVLEVSANNPLVEVSLGEMRTMASGGMESAVDVTISGSTPHGRHDALVTIRTDDSQTPVIRVPIRISSESAVPESSEP